MANLLDAFQAPTGVFNRPATTFPKTITSGRIGIPFPKPVAGQPISPMYSGNLGGFPQRPIMGAPAPVQLGAPGPAMPVRPAVPAFPTRPQWAPPPIGTISPFQPVRPPMPLVPPPAVTTSPIFGPVLSGMIREQIAAGTPVDPTSLLEAIRARLGGPNQQPQGAFNRPRSLFPKTVTRAPIAIGQPGPAILGFGGG